MWSGERPTSELSFESVKKTGDARSNFRVAPGVERDDASRLLPHYSALRFRFTWRDLPISGIRLNSRSRASLDTVAGQTAAAIVLPAQGCTPLSGRAPKSTYGHKDSTSSGTMCTQCTLTCIRCRFVMTLALKDPLRRTVRPLLRSFSGYKVSVVQLKIIISLLLL